MDATALVGPPIEAEGLELVEAALVHEAGRQVLRVTVDRPGGVDLDTLAELSGRLSRYLDAEGFAPGPYALEVSSPGIERPLKRPDHFERSVGERVKVKTRDPVGGSRVHSGVLTAADPEGITLEVDGAELRIAHADVTSARTVADWDAELNRSRA